MMQEKFFENKKAIIVLVAGSIVVLFSMGDQAELGFVFSVF